MTRPRTWERQRAIPCLIAQPVSDRAPVLRYVATASGFPLSRCYREGVRSARDQQAIHLRQRAPPRPRNGWAPRVDAACHAISAVMAARPSGFLVSRPQGTSSPLAHGTEFRMTIETAKI